jgi:XrtJ-associated TM-motif-TM protein
MNKKQTLLSVGIALLLFAAIPLRAQGGCVDSPEDPTIFLALVAGLGGVIAGTRRPKTR